jgi:hypothetical protein
MEPVWPCAIAWAIKRNCHFGLSKELQEIALGRFQTDFKHLPRHRNDLVNRAQHRLQATAAISCHQALQHPRNACTCDRATISPFCAADAKDDAETIVSDDPALGKRWLNLALTVKGD